MNISTICLEHYDVSSGYNDSGYEIPFVYGSTDDVGALLTYGYGGFRNLVFGQDFTITQVGSGGDTKNMLLLSASGRDAGVSTLTVFRSTAIRQLVDLENGHIIDADTIEEMMDRVYRILQEVKEDSKYAVHFSKGETLKSDADFLVPSRDERAGKAFGFDENGDFMVVDFQLYVDQVEREVLRAQDIVNRYGSEVEANADRAERNADKAEEIAGSLKNNIEQVTQDGLNKIGDAQEKAMNAIDANRTDSLKQIDSNRTESLKQMEDKKQDVIKLAGYEDAKKLSEVLTKADEKYLWEKKDVSDESVVMYDFLDFPSQDDHYYTKQAVDILLASKQDAVKSEYEEGSGTLKLNF